LKRLLASGEKFCMASSIMMRESSLLAWCFWFFLEWFGALMFLDFRRSRYASSRTDNLFSLEKRRSYCRHGVFFCL
jgi:hypothetical protein